MSPSRVVRCTDSELVEEPANSLSLRQLVTASAHGPDISVTWVQLAGRHRRLRTDRSTRVYVVLAGALTFRIGSELPAGVESGDLVVIPPGLSYELSGAAAYLVVNAPAFVEGDDVYLADRSADE